MTEMAPEVQALGEAVQRFVAASQDGALVSQALVLWESVAFDDEGETVRSVSYCVPTDNFSLTGGLGLLDAAQVYIRRDIFGGDE